MDIDADVPATIQELMDHLEGLRKDPSVDKKALNKTHARLEEAWLWSRLLNKTSMVTDPQTNETVVAGNCTCPAGVIDTGCPIHGRN